MMTSMRSTAGASPPRFERDQAPSTFTRILETLLAVTSGADAAVLVDAEGETVDYAGDCDPFELKVAAAHWQIVISELAEATHLGAIRQLTVRARTRSYVVRLLQERYALVLILHRHAAFSASERALQEADMRLCAEAGWPQPRDAQRWYSVEVEPDDPDRTRPARLRVADTWQPVEVMGCMVGLDPLEKGFRVRLPSGVEMLLVRERMGRWFSDEPIEG
jgi:hypothetical protein